MPELIWREDGDWLATRLHPERRYLPPKPPDPDRPYNPDSRWHPGMILIAGAQGIEVSVGKYKSQSSLLVKLALDRPFTDDARRLAKAKLARWNEVFNVWEFPILSQLKRDALEEVWALIEEIYLTIYIHTRLEFHWHYDDSPQIINALKVRIDRLNRLWTDGFADTWDYQVSLVYPALTKAELEAQAIAYLSAHGVTQIKVEDFSNVCVNWLRHTQSAYHILLKTDQDATRSFRQINRAIATAYPWLAETANLQILKRCGNGA